MVKGGEKRNKEVNTNKLRSFHLGNYVWDNYSLLVASLRSLCSEIPSRRYPINLFGEGGCCAGAGGARNIVRK